MNLLRSLLRTPAPTAREAGPGLRPSARTAGSGKHVIQVRLDTAHLLLRSGPETEVLVEGPLVVENTPECVLITERAIAPGSPPVCRLEVPDNATIDLHIAKGGLTVRSFRGTLRARVLSGSASVEQSEGRFRVVTVNGSVTVERVRGEIDVLTTHGNISAHQTHGHMQLVSDGGAMELEDIAGPLVARSTSGGIGATELRDTARLTTRTGAVSVKGARERLTVHTQSGDIEVDGSIVAHTTLESFKGNLNLKLGPETDAQLVAKVRQGFVRGDRISPLPGSSRRAMRSIIGAGQARIRLATGLGIIEIAGPLPKPRSTRAAAALLVHAQ